MSVVKRPIILASMAVVVLFTCIFFTISRSEVPNQFWDSLKEKISAGEGIVLFKNLTSFEWDMVCVLAPYSLQATTKAELPKIIPANNLSDYIEKISTDDDTKWVFAFLKSNNIVEIVSRGKGFVIYKAYSENCMLPANAAFKFSGNNLYITKL